MPHIISKACTKCNACLPECPTGSIVEGKEQYYIDVDTCDDHAACVAVCPVEAISLIVTPKLSRADAAKADAAREFEEEEA